jgi:hypothetical protein
MVPCSPSDHRNLVDDDVPPVRVAELQSTLHRRTRDDGRASIVLVRFRERRFERRSNAGLLQRVFTLEPEFARHAAGCLRVEVTTFAVVFTRHGAPAAKALQVAAIFVAVALLQKTRAASALGLFFSLCATGRKQVRGYGKERQPQQWVHDSKVRLGMIHR